MLIYTVYIQYIIYICISHDQNYWQKHLFHNVIFHHFQLFYNERLYFENLLITTFFLQLSLIIFTEGANNSDHVCIYT